MPKRATDDGGTSIVAEKLRPKEPEPALELEVRPQVAKLAKQAAAGGSGGRKKPAPANTEGSGGGKDRRSSAPPEHRPFSQPTIGRYDQTKKVSMTQEDAQAVDALLRVIGAKFGTAGYSRVTRVLWGMALRAEETIAAMPSRPGGPMPQPNKSDYTGIALFEEELEAFLTKAIFRSELSGD